MLGDSDNKVLAHLDLSSNGMGDEGAARLVEVLDECKVPAHFDLRLWLQNLSWPTHWNFDLST